MEGNNSLNEMAYIYCISLCVLYSPDRKQKKLFVSNAGQMSDADYEKAMEEVNNIKDEMSRRKMSVLNSMYNPW